MKKRKAFWLIPVILPVLLFIAAFSPAREQTGSVTLSNNGSDGVIAEATQTPYVVYVVVTATPDPEEPVIERGNSGGISLKNNEADKVVESVIQTLTANGALNGGNLNNNTNNAVSAPVAGGAVGSHATLEDGSTCTLSFDIVSEPTYANGAIVAVNEVFWKEWKLLNTGTCTWTPDYKFTFSKGWQIGSTTFSMNRTTKPGETLTVRLGLTAALQPGDYYSTYIMESPNGSAQYGELTVQFSVKNASYFAPTPTYWWEPRCKNGKCDGPWFPGPCVPWGCGPVVYPWR